MNTRDTSRSGRQRRTGAPLNPCAHVDRGSVRARLQPCRMVAVQKGVLTPEARCGTPAAEADPLSTLRARLKACPDAAEADSYPTMLSSRSTCNSQKANDRRVGYSSLLPRGGRHHFQLRYRENKCQALPADFARNSFKINGRRTKQVSIFRDGFFVPYSWRVCRAEVPGATFEPKERFLVGLKAASLPSCVRAGGMTILVGSSLQRRGGDEGQAARLAVEAANFDVVEQERRRDDAHSINASPCRSQ